jgi:hypothetical protein
LFSDLNDADAGDALIPVMDKFEGAAPVSTTGLGRRFPINWVIEMISISQIILLFDFQFLWPAGF